MLRNGFSEQWDGRDDELRATSGAVGEQWQQAHAADDPDRASMIVGEAVGLIDDIARAHAVIDCMVRDAADRLRTGGASRGDLQERAARVHWVPARVRVPDRLTKTRKYR